MKPKFNKHTQRWGVWTEGLSLWLTRWPKGEDSPVPYKFQSKQEAEAFIAKLWVPPTTASPELG